ncbi:acetyltransferase [Arthrobacter alpinus]|uniref:Acetyltransferase n=1 Tax=Arthrobacter alpinus TaxID=656366 RepID=A0A0S2LZR7_9MICC|nr:GNAT family N-acetyltransferase [Arthrobacter alpinus]ALO67066.1 acetyltransferase [Arthrobacter alpinus]
MDEKTSTNRPVIAIRPYSLADAADTLSIFHAAVTETASADYSPEQIQAWARPDDRDLSTWHAAMQKRNSYVATVNEEPAGFSDVDLQGYIDMMFVGPRFLRLGVARHLLAHVEAHARAGLLTELSANVSITARPFFERFGFVVQAEQHPVMGGVQLTNYAMKKNLLGN